MTKRKVREGLTDYARLEKRLEFFGSLIRRRFHQDRIDIVADQAVEIANKLYEAADAIRSLLSREKKLKAALSRYASHEFIEHYEALKARAKAAERELEGLRAFKRGVDEALNSGEGSYRP